MNSGGARRGQAFWVVSFTGEHSALGHPWGQKTLISSPEHQLPLSLGLGKGDSQALGLISLIPSSQKKGLDHRDSDINPKAGALFSHLLNGRVVRTN